MRQGYSSDSNRTQKVNSVRAVQPLPLQKLDPAALPFLSIRSVRDVTSRSFLPGAAQYYGGGLFAAHLPISVTRFGRGSTRSFRESTLRQGRKWSIRVAGKVWLQRPSTGNRVRAEVPAEASTSIEEHALQFGPFRSGRTERLGPSLVYTKSALRAGKASERVCHPFHLASFCVELPNQATASDLTGRTADPAQIQRRR